MAQTHDLIDAIIEREARRLQRRGRRLKGRLLTLQQQYPTVDEIGADVEAVIEADRAFIDNLKTTNWGKKRAEVLDEFLGLIADDEGRQSLELVWDGDFGAFFEATEAPLWKSRSRRDRLDVAGLIEQPVAETAPDGDHGPGVTYPIIFTHEVEANHLAQARCVGWAVVVCVVADWLASSGDSRRSLEHIELCGADTEIKLIPDQWPSDEAIPGPKSFGFRVEGDLSRRLRDFSQIDPEAHWMHWMDERRRASLELLVLREQGGAMLEVELDRNLRRLRLSERPRSTVVRKRRHVFVDTHKKQARDRYFSSTDRLEEAAMEALHDLVDDGYRIVYQRLESEGDIEERGRRPATGEIDDE